MKKILFFISLLGGFSLWGQSITLTFSGRDGINHRIPLDSVVISNQSKGWSETLYWPDTTLTMHNSTGIDDYADKDGFTLLPNNPNPFTGTTDVLLTMTETGTVILEISDVNGSTVWIHRTCLQSGTHQFRVTLSSTGMYVMTARQNGKTSSIKMVNNGGANGDGIEYIGAVRMPYYDTPTMVAPKSHTRGNTTNPFNSGDIMEYIGFATINGEDCESQPVSQPQTSSQTFLLQFEVAQWQLPTVSTDSVHAITFDTAVCGGTVVSDGGTPVTERGVCWNTTGTPTIEGNHTSEGCGTGLFSSTLAGLENATTYFVVAYATNSMGTAYGDAVTFTTPGEHDGEPCEGAASLMDIEGNTYATVQIGRQCWMRENLRTTHYADGTPIPQGSSSYSSTEGYWYYPNSHAENVPTYGLLYNWPAVMRDAPASSSIPSGVQGICPTGWHVPSDNEWTLLVHYVKSQPLYRCNGVMSNIAKSLASTENWISSTLTCGVGNTPENNNATGFSAIPAGGYYGTYSHMGNRAYFWSTTKANSYTVYSCELYSGFAFVGSNTNDRYFGFSVRCLRDE